METFKLDFVGVRAAKAGTTWLAACLSEHPQVCISNPKELHFFCTRALWPQQVTHRGKGEQWLRARFAHGRPGQIRGEITTAYLVDPASPLLIREYCPYIKIVASYRNPTESLHSLYHSIAKRYSVPRTVEDFLEQYPDLIASGFYHTHTLRYLDSFPLENLHFIIFDDIAGHSEEVLRELFEFLGVDAEFRPSILRVRVNERSEARSRFLRDFVASVTLFFRRHPRASRFREPLNRLGASRIATWMWEKNLRASPRLPMREDTRKRLVALYAAENTLLGGLLGRDLSHWNE